MLKVSVVRFTTADMAVAMAVASMGTVYTRAVNIGFGSSFAIWLNLTSVAGTVDMTITLEESYGLPADEGEADANWVTPANISAIVTNRTSGTPYMAALSPVVAPYLRLKIEGKNANNADALADVRLLIQSDF